MPQSLIGKLNILFSLFDARHQMEAESGVHVLPGRYSDFALGWKPMSGIMQTNLTAQRQVADED